MNKPISNDIMDFKPELKPFALEWQAKNYTLDDLNHLAKALKSQNLKDIYQGAIGVRIILSCCKFTLFNINFSREPPNLRGYRLKSDLLSAKISEF